MAMKFNNIVKILSRNFVLSCPIGNRKLKLITNTETVSKNKAVDMKALKNRTTWEAQVRAEKALKGKICSDNVYFLNEYETKYYPITEAILNHKDVCLDKSMLDCPNAILQANFLLNMVTKKQSKFIQRVTGIVIPTHKLHFLPKPRILAFCTTAEDIEKALANGACYAGDEILVKKLETGQIYYEEFDQAVCHSGAVPMLTKLKPILKEKLPGKGSPRIGPDVAELVDKYVRGYEYETKKEEGIGELANLTVPIGQIGWITEELVDNFLAFLRQINIDASTQIVGLPIVSVSLTCLPSDEKFRVDLTPYQSELEKARSKSVKHANKENAE